MQFRKEVLTLNKKLKNSSSAETGSLTFLKKTGAVFTTLHFLRKIQIGPIS
jgi:hypothetical protein